MHPSLELWHDHERSWLSQNDCKPEAGQLVIIALCSMVSLGTERLLTTQKLLGETAIKMRVPYMKGDFQSTFTYGYSLVGQVIDGPKNWQNSLVHLMHPHQNILVADTSDVSILPKSINPEQATLASNMETAVNAIWDSGIQLGDRVMVIGYGTIGALIAMLAQKTTAVQVVVSEHNSKKHQTISTAGHQNCAPDTKADFDVVFNTTARAEKLQEGLTLLRPEGKVVEVSWYGNKKIELNLGNDFHYGRKQIICSQVSQIPAQKSKCWDYKKRKELVFQVLADNDLSHLIDQKVSFEETPRFYEKLRKGSIDSLGVIIKY